MVPRALAHLAQCNDQDLFVELSHGMQLCVLNALQLWRDATRLKAAKRAQGFVIIKLLVEEEAAKFHILLDVARCPRNPSDRFSRQLDYFRQHLARGLYTRHFEWPPMGLEETRRHIDRERQTLYLDGLNDVDWIFRNDIERQREEAMYVDYVAYQDHFHDEHRWHCPDPRRLRMFFMGNQPNVLRVAIALHHVGVTTPDALRIVAETWRSTTEPENLTWDQIRERNIQILDQLEHNGLLRRTTQDTLRTAANQWRAPLFPLDLKRMVVETKGLKEEQAIWEANDF